MDQTDLYWFTFILVMLVGFFTYKLLTRHLAYFRRLGIVHEKPHLLYGNLSDVLSGKLTTVEKIQELSEKFAQSDIFGFYSYMSPAIYVRDPTIIKRVLRQNGAAHFESYGYFLDADKDRFLGSQLHLVKSTKEATDLLAVLTPVLKTASNLDGLTGTVQTCCHQLIEYIVSRGNEQLELKSVFRKHIMNVHASCTFGRQLNTFDTDDFSNADNFLSVANSLAYGTNPVQTVKTMAFYLLPGLMRSAGVQLMERQDIEILRKQFQQAISANNATTIARLLSDRNAKADNQLSDEQLTAQCVTFFTKGFESAVTLLSFALYELARDDPIQSALQQELERVPAKAGYDSLRSLPLLDAVVQETLRKWPPTPLLVRECTKPYLVAASANGERPAIPLRVGDKLYVSVWSLHRNADHFPDPERFDPERFMEGSGETATLKVANSEQLYIPFGIGRGCVGQEFVRMVVKMTLVALLVRFKVTPGDRTEEPLKLIESPDSLEARDGLWINFNERKRLAK
ncbi:cytochrome P450 9c1-like [Anopheles aquasalis]|uniref:cytochrome P450 9c1-like n=1 Tax=Anopheles aquasalis TaxID=42839 RepID=UPI00215B043F|nr:cytochrome P450 9c1-like [Anopheles aquasalis]